MVLLGAILQWTRILLTFTRPYLGTARSMSNTFAVSTYSGGSSRSEWIERRRDFRSRLSSARLTRISFALARASILWFRDRSGAIEGLEDVVLVAVAMGGESTHQRRAIRPRSANSPSPQPEVDLCRGWWTVSPCVCRDFRVLFVLSIRFAFPEFSGNSCPRGGIAKALGTDCHERGPGVDQISGVRGALDAAHSDDWNAHTRGHRGDLCQRDRADGGPRQAAGAAAQPRGRRAGLKAGSEGHRPQRVDQGHRGD